MEAGSVPDRDRLALYTRLEPDIAESGPGHRRRWCGETSPMIAHASLPADEELEADALLETDTDLEPVEPAEEYRFPMTDKPVDLPRMERAVREILIAVGEDPDREGLLETPRRVAKMYAEMFRGLRADPRIHMKRVFTQKYDEIVLIKDISFESMCEHHLLPFFGKAHIAYMPKGKVVGLSKIPRLVEDICHRPQIQEGITVEIADIMMAELDARGVAVVVEAEHTCMTIRGVRKPGSSCATSAMRGIFKENSSTRAEVMSLLRTTG